MRGIDKKNHRPFFARETLHMQHNTDMIRISSSSIRLFQNNHPKLVSQTATAQVLKFYYLLIQSLYVTKFSSMRSNPPSAETEGAKRLTNDVSKTSLFAINMVDDNSNCNPIGQRARSNRLQRGEDTKTWDDDGGAKNQKKGPESLRKYYGKSTVDLMLSFQPSSNTPPRFEEVDEQKLMECSLLLTHEQKITWGNARNKCP